MRPRRLVSLIALVLCACSAASPASPSASRGPAGTPAAIDQPLATAQALMFANRYAVAESAYQALIAAYPDDANVRAQHALFIAYRRELNAAYVEAQRARTLAPKDGHVAALVCRVDDWSGHLADAVTEGKQAVASVPDDPLARLFLSEAEADTGALTAARSDITAAQGMVTASSSAYLRAEVHRELSNLAHDGGDTGTQRAELAEAEKLQPGWIERTRELVDADTAAGDLDSARTALAQAVALAPDDLGTLTALGTAAVADEDYADAKPLWDRALAISPHDVASLIGRAQVAVAADRDLDTAERLLGDALHADPESRQAGGYLLAIDRYLRGDEGRARSLIATVTAGVDDKGLLDRTPPDPDAQLATDAATALASVNAVRRAAGLAPVTLQPQLSASALRHSWYWIFNNAEPSVVGLGIHREQPGLPGFSGVNPWDRAVTAGYGSRDVGEDITHRGGPSDAVSDWVNSVFHRFAIVRPDLVSIGYGEALAGPLAMEDMEFGFSGSSTADPVLYPPADAKGVPAIFVDNELPDPVPAGKPRTTGYPVTVTFPIDEGVRVDSFTLTGPGGSALDAYTLTPDARTENSASLLPAQPLRQGTQYTASISGSIDGRPWSRTWTFTTVS